MPPETNPPTQYSLQRPGALEALAIICDSHGIHLPDGRSLSWKSISEINLSHVIASRYNQAHFLCRIKTQEGTKVALAADAADAARCADYHLFLQTLHAAVAHNPQIQYRSGMSSVIGFRLLQAWFALMFLGLIFAVCLGMYYKGKIAIGILCIIGTVAIAYGFHRLLNFFAKPRTYDPADIPSTLDPLSVQA